MSEGTTGDGTAAPAPPAPAVDYAIPQTLSADAIPTAVSWTGGKDCNLALLHAARNPRLRVVCLVVFRPKARIVHHTHARFRSHLRFLIRRHLRALHRSATVLVLV